MVLTTISAVVFLVVFLADLFGLHTNPYLGILFFLVLPAIFLFGLALIPLGAWIERRRRARGRPPSEIRWPHVDLDDPNHRRAAVIVFALTMANVVIVSLAAYRGIEYMDSPQFCGQVCHTVMKPEFTAFQDSAHSRITCVQCHIGSGRRLVRRSKVSRLRRVLAVSFPPLPPDSFAGSRTSRPARDTLRAVPLAEKVHGDKIRRIVEYAEDEQNTESVTTLQVHVGGGSRHAGLGQGIHWHMNVANEVEYIATDDKRQVIPWVRVKDRTGAVREYTADGVTPDQLAKGERRRMDCLDCHNRPSHTMAPTPERAVNDRIASGEIPKTLPFVRREAVKALKTSYASQEAAEEGIARALREFYRTQASDVYTSRRQDIDRAVQTAAVIYRRNVFPEMNVQFGTYPNNIGHTDSPGCFRCHDDNHKAKDGKAIGQDCETCHKFE